MGLYPEELLSGRGGGLMHCKWNFFFKQADKKTLYFTTIPSKKL